MGETRLRAAMRRMGGGERWWAAEFAVRAIGLALLGLCAAAGLWLHRAVTQAPARVPTPTEFAAAALAVACWGLGWALLAEGPGLFRLIPVPGRHWLI